MRKDFFVDKYGNLKSEDGKTWDGSVPVYGASLEDSDEARENRDILVHAKGMFLALEKCEKRLSEIYEKKYSNAEERNRRFEEDEDLSFARDVLKNVSKLFR